MIGKKTKERQIKLNKKLSIAAIISLFLMILSFIFSNSSKNSPEIRKSALLNPKYKDSVVEITVGTKDKHIIIEKTGNFWFAHTETFDLQGNSLEASRVTIVDTKLIQTLLSNSTKIRDTFKISENERDFEKLELSYSNSTWIVYSENENSFSKIFFGINDTLSNKIALRADNSNISYEVENNFSQFLTTDMDYWSAGEIFYEAKNPETVKFDFPEKKVSISINSSNKDFNKISNSLLSIRHGKICEKKFDSTKKIAELELQDGDGTIFKIYFFKIGEEIFIKKQNSLADKIKDNSIYEISQWTFDRICQILEEEK